MKKFLDFSFRDPEKLSSLNKLREQLLKAMLYGSLVVGTVLFAFAMVPAIQKGIYLSITAYVLVYAWTVVITFSKRLSYDIKRISWLSLFYILGVVNLYMNGFNVDAGLFFLALIAMAALLGGPRSGMLALGCTSVTVSIAGFIYVHQKIPLSMGLPQTDPMLWTIGGIIFFLMGVFLIVSLSTVVRGLDRNLSKATTLAKDLTTANETLLEREERFRSLIDGSSDIISVVNREGIIQYVNAPAEIVLGYSPEELIGQNILKYIHPDDLAISIAALSPGTPPEMIGPFLELRAQHKDGSWRYLEVTGREMHDNPVIQGTIVNCRDITDRKEMEEKLRSSRFLLEKTFSSLSDGLFLIDARTIQIIDCNRAALKIFGYTREEMIGQSPGAVFRDASTFDEFSHQIDPEFSETDLLGRFETWMRRKDGTIFPTECSITPLIDKQSGHVGWVSLVHDITVRKRAEQLLIKAKDELEQRVAERTAEVQRTSNQLRELVAHSPAVIYSSRPAGDFCISFVSENVASLTGYTADRFSQDVEFWKNLIHPEDVNRVFSDIDKVRQMGGAVLEYRFFARDGSTHWVRDEMKLVKDMDGSAKEFVGSWEDITSQKLAESALRESEATMRVILNSTGSSLSLIDPNGILLSMNEAGAKFLGKRVNDILGTCIYDLLPSEVAQSRKARIDAVGKTGKPAHFEDFRGEYWFDNSIYPVFDEQGKVSRLVIHAINITESKKIQESLIQSEERYRTLADASPDMIYIIDRNDTVQYVNSFGSRFLRLPVEEIIGQPRSRFFSSTTSDHQFRNIRKVLEKGESVYAEDHNRTPERSIWLGTWLVPLKGPSGEISGVLGVSRDITAQKQAEIEILQAQHQLEERVRERTSELTSSQNQLRQLTSQLVSAQEEERRRISRELHDEAGQAIISLQYNLAAMMNEIPESHAGARDRVIDSIDISDKLMSQIRSLTRSLRPPVLEIGGINLSLKVYCEEVTERTGLSIDYQGEDIPGLPDEIGISLYRFVQEALTNTLKHAHATQVTIRLGYKKKMIMLSVADNGRGLEENIQSDGIGLLGMEERLSLFGGSIKLHSRKGRGVRITASVPWPRPIE